MIVIDIVLYV